MMRVVWVVLPVHLVRRRQGARDHRRAVRVSWISIRFHIGCLPVEILQASSDADAESVVVSVRVFPPFRPLVRLFQLRTPWTGKVDGVVRSRRGCRCRCRTLAVAAHVSVQAVLLLLLLGWGCLLLLLLGLCLLLLLLLLPAGTWTHGTQLCHRRSAPVILDIVCRCMVRYR